MRNYILSSNFFILLPVITGTTGYLSNSNAISISFEKPSSSSTKECSLVFKKFFKSEECKLNKLYAVSVIWKSQSNLSNDSIIAPQQSVSS